MCTAQSREALCVYCTVLCSTHVGANFKYFKYFRIVLIVSMNYISVHLLDNEVF